MKMAQSFVASDSHSLSTEKMGHDTKMITCLPNRHHVVYRSTINNPASVTFLVLYQ
jgi:hypothetical protein